MIFCLNWKITDIYLRYCTCIINYHKHEVKLSQIYFKFMQNWLCILKPICAGPIHWHKNYPLAGKKRQSPIDILPSDTKFDISLAANPLNIRYDANRTSKVVNTGHSFRVDVDGADYSKFMILYKLLFSRISRVRPSRKFPLQFMSIYNDENIKKITKLTPRELQHIVQNRKNNCMRK